MRWAELLAATCLMFATAAESKGPNGPYAVQLSYTCLYSNAGFNADDTPVYSDGQAVQVNSASLFGQMVFDSATHTIESSGEFHGESGGFVSGSSFTPSYLANAGTYSAKEKFSTSVHNGRTLVTISQKGDITGEITDGTFAGSPWVLRNEAPYEGVVTPSGVVVLHHTGRVVETQIITISGTPVTTFRICSSAGTLTPD